MASAVDRLQMYSFSRLACNQSFGRQPAPQNCIPIPINIMPSDDPPPPSPPTIPPPTQTQLTAPRKRPGRAKKIKEEPKDGAGLPQGVKVKQEKITDNMPVKKKRDRFKGMTEEEVAKKTLPDLICPNLDILIIGINPGLTAAYMGHHYAGPGNHFWKCMFLSGLIPELLNGKVDHKMLEYGIGSTNIVERTTRGSSDLSRKEIKEGGEILRGKVLKYKPKIAVFNGKGIYEVFCGNKNFHFGKQPEHFPDCPETLVYVMPSSSARCSQLPRAVDKVPFYAALKRLRDHLHGKIPQLEDSEVCFPDLELKVIPKSDGDTDGNPTEKEPAEPKLDKDGKPVVKKEPGTKKSPAKKTPPAKRALRKRKSTGKTPEHPVPENGQQQQQQQQQQPPPQQIVIAPDTVANGGMHPMVKQEPGGVPTTHGMMPYPPGPPPTTGASNTQQQPAVGQPTGLEGLFGGGESNLVKQEDLSELMQFGIGPGSFGPGSSVHVQGLFADSFQDQPPMMTPHIMSPMTNHAHMHPYWSFSQQ